MWKAVQTWICGSVVDQHYCKNLFGNTGRELLNLVEEIHGTVLTKDKALPSLACRPCERKVRNACTIKNRIAQAQESFEKKIKGKRCINVSPSSGQPKQKTRPTSARRSLGFESATDISDALLVSLYRLKSKLQPLYIFRNIYATVHIYKLSEKTRSM